MKMTTNEHTQNAEDFIGMSQDLTADENIDREQLAEQLAHTNADSDDVEAIALEIEQICQERF